MTTEIDTIEEIVRQSFRSYIQYLTKHGQDTRIEPLVELGYMVSEIPITDAMHFSYYKLFLSIVESDTDLYMDWLKVCANIITRLKTIPIDDERTLIDLARDAVVTAITVRPSYLTDYQGVFEPDGIESDIESDDTLLVYLLVSMLHISLVP